MTSSECYTCLSCQVSFQDGDLQRQHHKSDWHWYNLKRKVVSLPPVSPEDFTKKVLENKQLEAEKDVINQFYCVICKKKFNSPNSLNTHKKSKKHILLAGDDDDDADSVISNTLTEKERQRALSQEKETVSSSLVDGDTEIVEIEDSWEGLGVNECLFCCHWSQNMDKNLKHMTQEHSFYIPDPEFMVDVSGFLTYLGVMIGGDFECIKCGNEGRQFRSLEAVQKHMVDKGHSIINTEGDSYLQYSDYYDFSTSYPDWEMVDNEEVPAKNSKLWVDDDMCLVLPGGARVGHRSMKIYYKQNLSIEDKTCRNNTARLQLLRNYRAIGWYNGEQGKQKLRAEKRDKMTKQKDRLRLSVKANKFQTYFRPQVIF